MKKNRILSMLGVISLLAAVSLFAISFAQESGGEPAQGMPELGQPKEMKQLEHLVGKWEVHQKYQMDPTQEWQEMTGAAEFQMAVGGCALVMNFSGEMMGMPFKGMMVQCYSREYSQWQAIWTDNMGASITVYTGNMQGDKLVLTGTEKWGGQEYLARISTFNMKDTSYDWTYEMSMDGGKTWVKSMESHYVKKM